MKKQTNTPNLIDGKYSFEDIFDIQELKGIISDFYELTGEPIALISHVEQKVLFNIGWENICTQFHRKNSLCEQNCIKSNYELTQELSEENTFEIGQCKNGLVECAVPIIIEGVHWGNLFSGQTLLKEPNIKRFIKQAKTYNFNQKAYLKALDEVPIMDAKKVEKSLKFLVHLLSNIAINKLSKLRKQDYFETNILINNNTLDINFIIDKNGKQLYLSNSVENIFGYTVEEQIGKPYIDFVYPPEKENFILGLNKVIKNGLVENFRSKMLHKNGSIIDIEANAKLIKYKGQDVILGSLRDIGQQIELEKSTLDLESKNKILLESIPYLIFVFDKNGNFIEQIESKNKEDLLTKTNFIGKNVKDVMPTRIANKTIETLQRLFNTKKNQKLEYFIDTDYKRDYYEANLSILSTNKAIAIVHNISQQKEHELELKKMSLRQTNLIQAIPDILMEVDTNLVYTYANKEGKHFFGDDVIGKEAKYYFEGEQNTYNMVSPLFKGEKDTIYVESFQRRIDGEVRLLAWWCRTQKDPHGKITGTISTARDITEERAILQKLRESENLFRNLAESAATGIVIYGNPKFLYANPAAKKIMHYTDAEVVNLNFWDVIYEKDRDFVKSIGEKRLKGEKVLSQYEFRLQTKNGEIVWVSFSSSVTQWEGQLAGIATFIDISERKKSEIELLDSENRYRALSNTTSEAIYFSKDHKFIDCNLAALEMFGYTYEEAQSLHATDIVDFEYHETIKNSINTNFTESYIARGTKKDGSKFWIEIRGKNLIYKGEKIRVTSIKDIDEYKRNQLLLKESERKYRTVTESLQECIFTVDLEGNFTYLSSSFEKITNLKIGKFIGQPFIKSIHPRFQQFMIKKFSEGKKSQSEYNYEVEIIANHNKVIPIEISVKSLFDDEGKQIGRVGTFKDISKRKQTELKLQQSELFFRQVFENQKVSKLIINPSNGKIHKANAAAALFYGWTIDELEQMNVKDINSSSKPVIKETLKQAKNSEKESFEFIHKKADGSLSTVNVYSSPIKIENKTFLHSIIIDISERKRALKQLQKLQMAIEQSTSVVVITDNNGAIEYINPMFTKTTGYSIAEAIGQNPRILKSDYHPAEYYKILWETISSGKTWRGEFKNTTKKGELYWESAIISPIMDNNNNIINYVSIKDNITGQKAMEEALILAKEKAEESDKLKTAFLQNMSHEIRTPLNAVLGFSQLLQNIDTDNVNIARFSNIIHSSGERLLELINNVLDISKIESGVVKVEKNTIHINRLFKHVKDVVSLKAKEKGIEIITEMPWSEADSLIETDSGKLNQILINLVNNALKFTKEGSICFKYELLEDSDFLKFTVKDTGIGIPKAKQKKIFSRFFQVDQSIGRDFEGAGLGLSITKGLVNLLGGEISFESEYRKGTSFMFTIPYKGRKRVRKEDLFIPNFNNTKEINILIAEDDQSSYLFLKAILSEFNMNISRVNNGKKAVEALKNKKYNLVLMDINMPVLSGIEATKLIRQFDNKTPIIAQTAYAFNVEKENLLEIGCNSYISKPIDKNKLLRIIDEYLNKGNS